MTWRIEFDPSARKELDRLGHEPARRILEFLRNRVAALEDARAIGEALKGGKLGELWRYRVGDFRIVVDIQDRHLLILVVRIGHRSDVYRR